MRRRTLAFGALLLMSMVMMVAPAAASTVWQPVLSDDAKTFTSVSFADADHGWAACSWYDSDASVSMTGVLATTDGGATWATQTAISGNSPRLTSVCFFDESHGWACGYRSSNSTGLVLATSDGGTTWNEVTITSEKCRFIRVEMASTTVGYALATSYVTGDGRVFKTTDGGATWETVLAGPELYDVKTMCVISEDSAVIGYGERLVKTVDGGATWSEESVPGSISSIAAVSGDVLWLACEWGRVLKTTDGGTSWSLGYVPGYYFDSMDIVAADKDTAWVGGYQGESWGFIVATVDGGATWEGQYAGQIVGDLAIAGSGLWATVTHGILAAVTTSTPVVDTTAPVTTCDADSLWHAGPVTVTFTATDGSGVASTEYRIDGGEWQLGGSVVVDEAGLHRVDYCSEDVYGNVEAVRTAWVLVDTSAPYTLCTADSAWHNVPVTVTFMGFDTGSGLAQTRYCLDPVAPYSRDSGEWQSGSSVAVATEGEHTLAYCSVDNAGNLEDVRTCVVRVDLTGPTTSVKQAAVKRGARVKLAYEVDDSVSPSATAALKITDPHGKVVKAVKLGLKPTGAWKTYSFVCRLPRGTYRYSVLATDLAGNQQVKAGVARLVVK